MTSGNKAPRFWRSSFCYLFGSVLSKIAVFFMLPIYTARIPSEEMGLYDSTTALAILISSVLFLDVGVGLMRFSLSKESGNDSRKVLNSGLVLMIGSALLYIMLAALLFPLFEVAYYPLIVLYGLLNAVFMALGFVARAEGHHTLFALSGALSTFIQVGLNLLLILRFSFGYESLYISFCAGVGVAIIVISVRLRLLRSFKLSDISFPEIKRLFRFCLPLGIHSAAFWLLNSLNRVLVTGILGSEAGGYYAVALKFTQILVFVSTCFQFAWQEISFAKGFANNRESASYYTAKTDLFLRIFMAAFLMIIPGIRVGLWIFPGFIHASYSTAIALLPVAFFGAFLSVFSSFLDPIFGAAGKTGTILLSTLAGALANLGAILLLFKMNVGVIAANIAFLGGYAVTVAWRIFSLRRTAHLRINMFHMLWFLPAVAAVFAVYYFLSPVCNAVVFVPAGAVAFLLLFPELRLIFQKKAKKYP